MFKVKLSHSAGLNVLFLLSLSKKCSFSSLIFNASFILLFALPFMFKLFSIYILNFSVWVMDTAYGATLHDNGMPKGL